MLKELKENMDKEQKEIWKGIYEQNENINKDTEIIKGKQILRMKSTITDIKRKH